MDGDTPTHSPFTHPILGAAKCYLTPDIFRMHYFFARMYPFCRKISALRVLEIGAGAGMLGVLFQADFGGHGTL